MGKVHWKESDKNMKDAKHKREFLEHLRKIPIIQVACEKSGVSRATVYRWREKEVKFRKELKEALSEGEALINDMSESQLISLIREKSYSAISFWLRNRHQKFRDRIDVNAVVKSPPEKLTPEQATLMREALKMASSECNPNDENDGEET